MTKDPRYSYVKFGTFVSPPLHWIGTLAQKLSGRVSQTRHQSLQFERWESQSQHWEQCYKTILFLSLAFGHNKISAFYTEKIFFSSLQNRLSFKGLSPQLHWEESSRKRVFFQPRSNPINSLVVNLFIRSNKGSSLRYLKRDFSFLLLYWRVEYLMVQPINPHEWKSIHK